MRAATEFMAGDKLSPVMSDALDESEGEKRVRAALCGQSDGAAVVRKEFCKGSCKVVGWFETFETSEMRLD